MVSQRAAEQLAELFKEYIPRTQWEVFLNKLAMVEGNKSYHDTIRAVKEKMK